MDDPPGARTVGSKQVFKIDISGATDVTSDVLPGNALPDGIVPVTKSAAVMDLCANSQLPKGKQPEK